MPCTIRGSISKTERHNVMGTQAELEMCNPTFITFHKEFIQLTPLQSPNSKTVTLLLATPSVTSSSKHVQDWCVPCPRGSFRNPRLPMPSH